MQEKSEMTIHQPQYRNSGAVNLDLCGERDTRHSFLPHCRPISVLTLPSRPLSPADASVSPVVALVAEFYSGPRIRIIRPSQSEW